MELEELLEEMEAKMYARDLSDDYLKEHGASTRKDLGINEYAYGVTMIPCEWVYPYLKELQNSIPKAKIEDKIKKYKSMADDFYTRFIESNRLNQDIRDAGFSCDRKVEVLQELLEGK